MKRQFTNEDLAMVAQWAICILICPFVLLPLFPRQEISFATRLLIVLGTFLFSGVMTVIYLRARSISRRAAAQVANITAAIDAGLVLAILLVWPRFIPEAFWILTVLVIVIAARFGYKPAAIAALGFTALYLVTIFAGYGPAVKKAIIADAMVRLVLMWTIAGVSAYLTESERRGRNEARILSRIAAAIGATLEMDELLSTVVEGISEATGLGRCTAFLVSSDGRWAAPKSTTERDNAAMGKLLAGKLDLKADNVASRVVETREPFLVDDAHGERPLDSEGTEERTPRALMVLPITIRDEVKGIVTVERRGGRRPFSQRELRICKAILAQAAAGLENTMRYAEEQRKRSEADTLYRASRELGSTLELGQVLENACRLAARNTGASGCAAFLLDERRAYLVPKLMIGGGARRTTFPPDGGIELGEFEEMYNLAQRPPAMCLSSPAANWALPDFIRSAGAVLMAPFYMHGAIGGLLCATDTEPGEFDESQAAQLTLVANEVALAVINARLHERIKADATQLASLVQLTNAIGSTADLPTIMRLTLDSMRHLFDCTFGLIYRIDEKDGTMRCVESFGYGEDVLARLGSPPYPRVEDCWTVSEGRLIGVDDLASTKVACRTLARIGRGSVMCVGMQSEGRTLGVLHVRSERPDAFGEEDQQLAMAFADQVGLALQRALLFEEIKRLAITDPLTGVFNVRQLGFVLSEEVSRARRYRRPVSFLMVDLDNLKACNDTLGHQQGDVVLSQTASIIDSSTRDADKVFRYGGDEFCVVLPETDSDEAVLVAEKVRRAVADFHFAGEEKVPGGSVTVSLGVASFPRDCEEETTMVHQADLALYAAKQTGRNSVASAF